MKRVTALALVAFVCLVLVGAVMAASKVNKAKVVKGKTATCPMEQMKKQLGITPEQSTQLADLRKARMEEIGKLSADVKAKMQSFQQAWQGDSDDEDALTAKFKELQAARTAVQDAHLKYQLQLRKILTPAQRQKMAAMMKAGRQKMQNMRAGKRLGAGKGMGAGTCPMCGGAAMEQMGNSNDCPDCPLLKG